MSLTQGLSFKSVGFVAQWAFFFGLVVKAKNNLFFVKLNFWLVAVLMLLLVYVAYTIEGYRFTFGVVGKIACFSGILTGYIRRDFRIGIAGLVIFLLTWGLS